MTMAEAHPTVTSATEAPSFSSGSRAGSEDESVPEIDGKKELELRIRQKRRMQWLALRGEWDVAYLIARDILEEALIKAWTSAAPDLYTRLQEINSCSLDAADLGARCASAFQKERVQYGVSREFLYDRDGERRLIFRQELLEDVQRRLATGKARRDAKNRARSSSGGQKRRWRREVPTFVRFADTAA